MKIFSIDVSNLVDWLMQLGVYQLFHVLGEFRGKFWGSKGVLMLDPGRVNNVSNFDSHGRVKIWVGKIA